MTGRKESCSTSRSAQGELGVDGSCPRTAVLCSTTRIFLCSSCQLIVLWLHFTFTEVDLRSHTHIHTYIRTCIHTAHQKRHLRAGTCTVGIQSCVILIRRTRTLALKIHLRCWICNVFAKQVKTTYHPHLHRWSAVGNFSRQFQITALSDLSVNSALISSHLTGRSSLYHLRTSLPSHVYTCMGLLSRELGHAARARAQSSAQRSRRVLCLHLRRHCRNHRQHLHTVSVCFECVKRTTVVGRCFKRGPHVRLVDKSECCLECFLDIRRSDRGSVSRTISVSRVAVLFST